MSSSTQAATPAVVSETTTSAARLHWHQHLLLLLLLIGALLLGLSQIIPPAVVPADAPPTTFSAVRAQQHLAAIAAQPHPIGSTAHAQVRSYLIQELTRLGLQPAIQRSTEGSDLFGDVYVGQIENVAVRLTGTSSRRAILIAAHYDSVPSGPGANDDGVAIAAMLESIRVLQASSPRANDIIFLFTDGEETGLLGAQAFMGSHPWAQDIAVALNFEARGANGPVLMFETSDTNARLISDFVAGAASPVGGSFFSDVYRYLGNATDFTVFKNAALPGLNFAYIGDGIYYHAALDTTAHVDPRTLQHTGSYMTSLAQHFGNDDLDYATTSDAVFFNLAGHLMVWYPAWLVMPLTAIAALALVAVLVVGISNKLYALKGLAIGFAALILGILLSYMVVNAAWRSVLLIREDFQQLPDVYANNLYIISFVVLTVAAEIVLYHFMLRYVSFVNLLAGALIGWLILAVATTALLPGGTYLFVWPLLSTVLSLALVLFRSPSPLKRPATIVLLTIAALPGILILPPIAVLFLEALSVHQPVPTIVLTVFLTTLLVPYLATVARRLLLGGTIGLAGVVLLLSATMLMGFDADTPKPNSVFYALDSDREQALWLSSDPEPDDWTVQFFADDIRPAALPSYLPLDSGQYLQATAPRLPLAAPKATVLSDITQNGLRSLQLRLTSPRGAHAIWLIVESPAAVLSASVDGKAVYQQAEATVVDSRPWRMFYWTLTSAGIDVTLTTKADAPVTIRVIDQTFEIPEPSAAGYTPRPPLMISAPYRSNETFVSTEVEFATGRLE